MKRENGIGPAFSISFRISSANDVIRRSACKISAIRSASHKVREERKGKKGNRRMRDCPFLDPIARGSEFLRGLCVRLSSMLFRQQDAGGTLRAVQ
jgi:hypothetical protein